MLLSLVFFLFYRIIRMDFLQRNRFVRKNYWFCILLLAVKEMDKELVTFYKTY